MACNRNNEEDNIWSLLNWFVVDSIGSFDDINRDNWESWESMDKSCLAKRRCGYDLLTQIIFLSHMKFIQQVEEKGDLNKTSNFSLKVPRSKIFAPQEVQEAPRKVYAPETMAVDFGGDKMQHQQFDTCKVIPETQSAGSESDDFFGEEEVVVPPFKAPQITPKPRKKRHKRKMADMDEDEKDAMIRARYPSLDKILTSTEADETVASKGIFGIGPSPKFRRECPEEEEESYDIDESQSPSIFIRKADKIRKADDESLIDEDFVDKKISPNRLSNKQKVKGATNRWGIEISEVTKSQVKRTEGLKQGKLDNFLKGDLLAKSRKNEDEENLQLAIELSKSDRRRQPLSPQNSNADDRQLQQEILGNHNCEKCVQLYNNSGMKLRQLRELVAKCQEYKVMDVEVDGSPKYIWDLDIREARETDKTQVGSPLMTRKLRREMRNAKS